MKIQVNFFKEDFIAAIGAGIYEISVCKNGNIDTLYIGESVFAIVRCATHLYRLKKKPEYFGFTDETIEDSNIVLPFRLIEEIQDTQKRKKREKEIIKERKPINQSGLSDRQKGLEERIEALNEFLRKSVL